MENANEGFEKTSEAMENPRKIIDNTNEVPEGSQKKGKTFQNMGTQLYVNKGPCELLFIVIYLGVVRHI